MKSLLAAALVSIAPLAATAGGWVGVAVGSEIVEVPCYPENRFELCAVPPVPIHHAGYLPRTVPSLKVIAVTPASFSVFVTPNIVPYELALRDAAIAAARHCGQQDGETVVARITERERYAPENLESWKFSGICE